MEFLDGTFLNTHLQRLHALNLIRRLLPPKLAQLINLLLESINFAFSSMCICCNSFMVLESFFSIGSHISSYGVFGSVLMNHNFSGWFLVGHIAFNLVFLVTSSNLFCFPLWKVTTSFGLFLGYPNHIVLLTWPISTFFYKTYSIFFFMFLFTIVGIIL
jgi:hypothetical protein